MPKLKHYTAQRDMHMDCGHLVKEGETFHVSSVFTCDKEGSWPMRILMACLAPKANVQPDRKDSASERSDKEQTRKSAPAQPPAAKTQA